MELRTQLVSLLPVLSAPSCLAAHSTPRMAPRSFTPKLYPHHKPATGHHTPHTCQQASPLPAHPHPHQTSVSRVSAVTPAPAAPAQTAPAAPHGSASARQTPRVPGAPAGCVVVVAVVMAVAAVAAAAVSGSSSMNWSSSRGGEQASEKHCCCRTSCVTGESLPPVGGGWSGWQEVGCHQLQWYEQEHAVGKLGQHNPQQERLSARTT